MADRDETSRPPEPPAAGAPSLRFELVRRDALGAADLDALYALFATGYNHVSRERFVSDLSNKQYVGLLRDDQGALQGLTTFGLNPGGSGTERYHVLFSGDTYIAPAAWGSQELVRGFCRTAGQLVAGAGGKPVYWLLISKGHRTYMYLPLFFRRYYPALDPKRRLPVEESLHRAVHAMFGDSWRREEGVIRFAEKHGELTPALAQATWQRSANKHVAFFLERNPDFASGVELACMTELSAGNLRGMARRSLLEGMESPLPWE